MPLTELELIAHFKKRGLEEDKSSKEWEAAYPGCQQASYRAGCANTFTEVVEKMQSSGYWEFDATLINKADGQTMKVKVYASTQAQARDKIYCPDGWEVSDVSQVL